VGVGTEEIYVLHVDRKGSHGLNGIEAEEDVSRLEESTDGFDVNPPAREVMAGSEGHKFRSRREGGFDQLGRNLSEDFRFEVTDFDALRSEVHPGIDIGGIIFLVADEFVPVFPSQAIGKEAQPEGRGAEKSNFGFVRADEGRANLSGLFNVVEDFAKFLVVFATRPDMRDDGIRDAAGQDGHSGMAKENLFLSDRKLFATFRF